MAEKINARTRLISLVEIMTMYSDELNILTIDELCEKLAEYGYEVSKRMILSDIKAINTTPIKIISVSKPKKGYYLAKCFSQAAINLILEAICSSDMLCDDDMAYITNYLRRNTCLPTLDLILNTTVNFYSLAPKKEISTDALYTLRTAIRDKKQARIKFSRIAPGDRFSRAEIYETIIVNPIKIAVSCGVLALIFTRANTPKKLEFINIPRIKEADVVNEASVDFIGHLPDAVNFFDGSASIASEVKKDCLLIKFKAEYAEIIENGCSAPIEFRKSKDEGYYVAKIFTVIDKSLIGWLFTLGNKVQILKPDSLKELFSKE